MSKIKTVGIVALLAIMLCQVHTFADDKEQGVAKGALTAEQIDTIRNQMAQHRQRALGWARMAYFDEALRELQAVETLYQSINGRISEHSTKGPATYYKLNNEQTYQLVQTIKIRAETYKQSLARFQLPKGALSDFKVIPIPLPGNKACWAVIYTVRSPDLTKEQVMLDPAFYQTVSHIPATRSYIGIYRTKKLETTVSKILFKKAEIIEVPEGYTPFYCEPPHAENGRLIVHLTGYSDKNKKRETRGAMVFFRGRLCQLADGPSKGPAIVLPGKNGYHLNGLTRDGRCAFRKTKKGAMISFYNGNKCYRTVRFEGKQIIKE